MVAFVVSLCDVMKYTQKDGQKKLMFIYSENATKFCEISNLILTGTTQDKSKVEISQNFVAFSEYMNFKSRVHCSANTYVVKFNSTFFILQGASKKQRMNVKYYTAAYCFWAFSDCFGSKASQSYKRTYSFVLVLQCF